MLRKYLLQIAANFIAVAILSAGLHRLIPTFFYVAVISLFVAAILGFIQFKFLINTNNLKESHVSNIVLFFFISTASLLSFSFLSTVPLNVDRSFSVWMINQIATNSNNQEISKVESHAAKFFSEDGGEIKRRINEQVSLGNIEVKNGRVYLTGSGTRIWKINRLVSRFFGLNRKYSG